MLSIDLRMIDASGIGTYLQNLIPRILDLRPEWNFSFIGYSKALKKYPWSQKANITLIEDNSPIYSIKEQYNLLKKIPKSTTLFWSPHYNIPIFYKKRLLVTIHDVFHLAMPHYLDSLSKQFYARFMFKRVDNQADSIICVSDFTKQELLRFYPKSPITKIHNGVSESWFDVQPKMPIHTKPYLIYLGNVKPHKNLGILLTAFYILSKKIPHDLVIVGKKEGFLTPDASTEQQFLFLKDRIKFTGYISEEAVKQYVKQAQTLILPSLYEGFGLPPLEAMACRCPVIASKIPALEEVCENAALYFDPFNAEDLANKINTIINNKSLREKLCSEGVERSKKFSWNRTARETMRLIEKLV